MIASFSPSYRATLVYIEWKGRQNCKKVLLTDISNTKILFTDLKPTINKFIHEKWQKSWDDNMLHHIQDTIGEKPADYRRNRKEVVLSWHCIAYTHITHSHFLKRENTPICSMCKVPLTIKHFLLNCVTVLDKLTQNTTRQAT